MKPDPATVKVRCRLIRDDDLDCVAALLDSGFPGRGLDFWRVGLARMALRQLPDGAPRFGYCLDAGETLEGVILLIAATRIVDGEARTFSNVAGWYVASDFRAYAQLLVSMALKNRQTSYFNVTAAPQTWTIVENQGYVKYCSGLFFALAAMKRPSRAAELIDINASPAHPILGTMIDGELLRRHAAMGCRVIVARENGEVTGLVFRRMTARAGRLKLPALLVIHATSRDRMIALAGNLGRLFMREAAPIIAFDANGPVAGLHGYYTERRGRKYARGPHLPELCGLADTELAVFGV